MEAIQCLTKADFMINLKKSHLVEDSAKVLGHYWSTGGFWAPNVDKLQALISKTNEELGNVTPLGFMRHSDALWPVHPQI